ncbi:MAG: hypothetical protein ACYS8W_09615 [Planctomycetota bacterium]|jgi:hypothetical protein
MDNDCICPQCGKHIPLDSSRGGEMLCPKCRAIFPVSEHVEKFEDVEKYYRAEGPQETSLATLEEEDIYAEVVEEKAPFFTRRKILLIVLLLLLIILAALLKMGWINLDKWW